MRKITALAFAWWYYDKWQELKDRDDTNVIALWDLEKDGTIQKIFTLVDDFRAKGGETPEDELIKWSIIPFFLITAHPTRDYIFKEIFTTLWIYPIGIFERDIVSILDNHTVYGYNDEQKEKNLSPLKELDYHHLRKSVYNLRRNYWALFSYTQDDLSKTSIGTDVWLKRKVNQMFVPENEKDIELIKWAKSLISGNPQSLQLC